MGDYNDIAVFQWSPLPRCSRADEFSQVVAFFYDGQTLDAHYLNSVQTDYTSDAHSYRGITQRKYITEIAGQKTRLNKQFNIILSVCEGHVSGPANSTN
jgi:hypothetical protein